MLAVCVSLFVCLLLSENDVFDEFGYDHVLLIRCSIVVVDEI